MSTGKDTIDMKSNKMLRAEAREALLGNLRLTVGAILVYSLVVYALQFLTNISGLNSLAAFLLIGLTLLYLTAILQGLLEIGLSSIFLDLSFGQPSSDSLPASGACSAASGKIPIRPSSSRPSWPFCMCCVPFRPSRSKSGILIQIFHRIKP